MFAWSQKVGHAYPNQNTTSTTSTTSTTTTATATATAATATATATTTTATTTATATATATAAAAAAATATATATTAAATAAATSTSSSISFSTSFSPASPLTVKVRLFFLITPMCGLADWELNARLFFLNLVPISWRNLRGLQYMKILVKVFYNYLWKALGQILAKSSQRSLHDLVQVLVRSCGGPVEILLKRSLH